MGGKFIPNTDARPIYFGPHRGIHRIYVDIAAYHTHRGPEAPVVMKWWEAEEGDWFVTTCGRVAQCLKAYELRNSRGQVTRVIKTCFGSFPYYVRKTDGLSNSTCLVEKQRKVRWKHSISSMAKPTTNRYGKHMNKRKKRFAYLWLVRGLDPANAYMLAFSTISHKTARKAALYMIRHEKSNLYHHIAMTYKDLFDSAGLKDEDIAAMIANEAKNARSSKDRLEAIKLALEMRGEYSAGVKAMLAPPPSVPPLLAGEGLTAPPPQLEATLVMRELPAPEAPEEAVVLSVEDTPREPSPAAAPTLERNYAQSLGKLNRWRSGRRDSIRPRLRDFDADALRKNRREHGDQAA